MRICVVITTLDGAAVLPDTLESWSVITIPDAIELTLCIVDNGSTDASARIIRSFSHRLPIQYRYFPSKGKNKAINFALRGIRCEYVLFTDDDVLVPSDFIEAWHNRLRTTPGFDIYGGRVNPIYPEPLSPPLQQDWLEMVCFAKTKPQLTTGPADPGEIFGNNMVVRNELFSKLLFDESAGPAPGSYGMGSETEFNLRAARDYYARAYFDNDITVRHMIRKHQMTPQWVFARAEKFGQGIAYRKIKFAPYRGPFLLGAPRYLYARMIGLYFARFKRPHDAKWVYLNWRYYEAKGEFFCYRRLKNHSKTTSAGA